MSRPRPHGSLGRLDDVRLATLVGRGDAAAFEALYDRHHASLLAFCRHMLGSREDGEDALQQTFLRAHRALSKGRPPAAVRAWLYAIARNRCLTLMAARRDVPVPVELPESGSDDLAENVRRRAELRELVTDLRRLPDDQRAALVLSELGDLSHAEIGAVIGCPPAKVKALAFQAREALIADRNARCIPCAQIRGVLETATGGVLRRASLRRHLRQCAPCDAYRLAVSGGRRGGLAALLPVAPTAGRRVRRAHRAHRARPAPVPTAVPSPTPTPTPEATPAEPLPDQVNEGSRPRRDRTSEPRRGRASKPRA